MQARKLPPPRVRRQLQLAFGRRVMPARRKRKNRQAPEGEVVETELAQ
jgi:hypothetical protein